MGQMAPNISSYPGWIGYTPPPIQARSDYTPEIAEAVDLGAGPDTSLTKQLQPGPDRAFIAERNKAYTKEGASGFNTPLKPGEETKFRQWVGENKVPFDPDKKESDYDMRGFYRALQAGDKKATSAINPNDKKMHYPDWWKTPMHETFSRDSQWATSDAPTWNKKDQLVTKDGEVLYDERRE